ncbi:16S rRNA (adenine(1518)-N(6)/adenine(1519)-N(6))-dimethyltransferase RsmA [Ekhidna sp. To15]|uniref:16S rRNA (adenine(1518)-N(6)/adenine(1519)-N(6))- dimethyltransferase RsmA n=1 Tax=Ekhidna sp. To15 TaxID=3395267 RepID=UPI003F52318D
MANVRPKKHLGQHFLKDENIAQKIVEALKNEENLPVFEIGPGTGVLTKYLLQQNGIDFYALDVDAESIDYLKANFLKQSDRFLFQDYLKYDVPFDRFNVIGNFPYNISSQLFFKFWDDRDKVDEVVCMIQKEVADRICASHGNKTYGILSVLLQAFYDIEYLFKVPPGVFNPPPKVQSAVIRLKRNKVKELACDEKLFKRVVKAGFGKRRKTLRNALKDLNLPESIAAMEVLNQRAEQLSVQEFISLTEKIS